MKPDSNYYNVGELVGIASTKTLGLITRPTYWALDEYLGGETQFVDVLVEGKKKQYPARYLLRIK